MDVRVYNLPTILSPLLMMAVLLAVFCLFKCKCLPIKFLHKLLQKLDIVEKGPEDSDEKPQSTLHGHKVPIISVYTFTFHLSSTCVIIGIAFINKLLVQTTTSCNPKVDCFLKNSSTSDGLEVFEQNLYTTPVNCSNLTDDSEFVCYKFQFDLISALAVAGGLITIAKLNINIMKVLSWLMHRQAEERKTKFTLCFLILILFSIFSSGFIMFEIFVLDMHVTTNFFFIDGILLTFQVIVFCSTTTFAPLALTYVYCPPRTNEASSLL